MAPSSEQDNRVRIPDGTAAVCAEARSFGENRPLGNREGRARRRGPSPFRHESEDLRSAVSPFCASFTEVDSSRKIGRGTRLWCRGIFVFGGFL